MSQIQIHDWSKVYTPPFSYVDESLTVNSSTNLFEQGMDLVRVDGLDDLNDQTINSYNSFYLTSRKKVSDIFTFDQIDSDLETITTPLKFVSGNGFKYIKFVPDSYELVDNETINDDSTRFQLDFDSQLNLIVKHLTNNVEYRLVIDNDDTIYFATTSTSVNYQLGYLIDSGGFLVIYKTTSTPSKILKYSNNSLIVEGLSANDIVKSSNSLINIDYNFTNLAYDINTSWVSYVVNNQNLAHIDDGRSAYGLENQFVISTTYNNMYDGVDINFINLKSHTSEQNVVKRGSILNTGPDVLPGTDFRFYTSLNTGNSQEKGNENIVLTYVFYDKDIYVPAGTDTYFSTTSTIFPYERLNINDAKFVVNGAYGSFAPNVSDNIKKMRTNSVGFNNGRYLCTWLSGNGMGDAFRWVDRYYYPDLIDKENAYTTPLFNPSFDDPVDEVAYTTLYQQQIEKSPIFDKTSDLFLEPDTQYVYQRVDTANFETYLDTISSNTVHVNRTPVELDGNTSSTVPIDDINETRQFTISFDLYISPNKTYGYSILGNLTNFGFSVLNDTFITPIMFTMQDDTLFYYNTDHKLVAKQKFDRNVKDVIRFEGLDNYIVVCEDGYVYNLRSNNTIPRLNIVPQLSSYISFTPYNNKVAFLTDTSGECTVIDNITLESSLSTASNTSTDDIQGVFFSVSALKGVPGDNVKLYDIDNVCYVKDETIYKQHTTTDEALPVVQSTSGLEDYAIDTSGNFLFVHNTNKLSLYNKNRKKLFTAQLSAIPLSGNKCEFVREFVSGQETSSINTIGIDQNGSSRLVTYDYSGTALSSTAISGNLSATQSNFTNYNYSINSIDEKVLDFKIRLENRRDKTDIFTKNIPFDYSNISEGYVTFAYVFDAIRGIITLMVNGVPNTTIRFDPAKYAITDIFNDDITIGGTGFYNGQSLADFLTQPTHYDTYDTTIKNVFILNKPLAAGESAAIALIDTSIDPLTISIPSGQRSNIEEIVRLFKFGVPESYSNHINVQIKNSGIMDTEFQKAIESNVRNTLADHIKGDVVIDDISFIDYSPIV